jgi:capsular polysaccharide biosynthesis protein
MELREYLKIFKQHSRLFWSVIILIMASSFSYFLFRPLAYNTSFTVNITRLGSQETADYRYDDFYRLQADEKFADTLVQWLKSPRFVADIYDKAGIKYDKLSLRGLSRAIKGEKMSSQVVAVSFSASTPKQAEKIAGAISTVIENNTNLLNAQQQQKNWFKIAALTPVSKPNTVSFLWVLVFSLLAGIFLAFWVVLIVHYSK